MTFASELARTVFHRLPTQTQSDYCRLETEFAKQGKFVQVQAVCAEAGELEVTVRISEKLKLPAVNTQQP